MCVSIMIRFVPSILLFLFDNLHPPDDPLSLALKIGQIYPAKTLQTR